MMKVLHLAKRELKLLKKTVIIITLILTVFLSALFGVISVQADLTQNIYDYIDSSYTQLCLDVKSASLSGVQQQFDGLFVTAQKDGITRNAVITNAYGTVFNTSQTSVTGDTTTITNYNGAVICLNECTLQSLQNYSYTLLQGDWVAAENEICISSCIAGCLNAAIGDALYIDGGTYTVTGIYSATAYGCHYLVTVSGDMVLDKITAYFYSSKDLYTAYSKLTAKGFTAEMPFAVSNYLDNLYTVKWFLTACAVLVFIVVIAVLYSLTSIFYRQRKGYICRLKLLGATNFTVAAVYCGIAIFMLAVSAVTAAALAVLFNRYIMGICENLLGIAFEAHFNFAVPAAVFAVLVAVVLVIYILFARKTKTTSVAQEIRYE
ncbi:MAG: hypothetical protein LUF82_00725 [Clostridia bacterium]|nr:hypothetical protein [Clostridia bacterium]